MITTSQVFRNMNAQAIDAQKQAYSATEVQQTGESGKAMGYGLKVMADPGQSLMDSMEELTMTFEEKKMTEIGQRKVGEMRGKSSITSTAIDKWMKAMPDMPDSAFMEKLLRHVRTLMARGGTAGELLKMLDEGSHDASHQFAMLDILEQTHGLDEGTTALVRKAKQLLEQNRGEEVRAGLNLATVVNAQTENADEIQQLRDLYRGEVLGFKSPQDCFRSLLAQRGTEGIRESIDFLVEACGVDLQSATPSKSEEELGRILSDLQCVEVLTTVMEKGDVLCGKMRTQFGERCALNGGTLMERILNLTEASFVDEKSVEGLVKDTGVKPLLARLYFTTSLIGLFRALSPRVFGDESARQRMIDAGQLHLDDLVAQQQEIEDRA